MRKRNLYDPLGKEPYPLSRSKLELFLECPRCFYLDRRCGIGRPGTPPYTLNLAVDTLLKHEFDEYRSRGEPHPLMIVSGVDAVPYSQKEFFDWRDTTGGIRSLHRSTNIELYGLVDDVWVSPTDELSIVDYKATSTVADITLDDRDRYKRQLECYQWLLRQNGHRVSDTGYFVFANAQKDRPSFERTLHFAVHILPYTGSDAWVEDALKGAKECLDQESPPSSTNECEWCEYRRSARTVEL